MGLKSAQSLLRHLISTEQGSCIDPAGAQHRGVGGPQQQEQEAQEEHRLHPAQPVGAGLSPSHPTRSLHRLRYQADMYPSSPMPLWHKPCQRIPLGSILLSVVLVHLVLRIRSGHA